MKLILSILGVAATVAAHGYVDNATISGKDFQFWQPFQDPYMNPKPQRIARPVEGNGPITDVTLADIQCGGYSGGGIVGSSPAALHADAAAGSTVQLYWTLWPESHMGPTVTYMARCPDTGCNNYMPGSSAVWFKVQQAGRTGTTNTWGATPLMKAGAAAPYTIPSCLKPGYYLVRHELIALHAAWQYPGAQFYVNCHQLKVSGTGTKTPTSLVAFPGAYKGADPGVTYDAYKAATYTVPGPALLTC